MEPTYKLIVYNITTIDNIITFLQRNNFYNTTPFQIGTTFYNITTSQHYNIKKHTNKFEITPITQFAYQQPATYISIFENYTDNQ